MINSGDIIKEGYKLLHSDKINEAEEKFKEIYSKFKEGKIKNGDEDFNKVISCILGLGEVNMKRGEMKEALKFYLEGNKLTNGEDFNILFNLGVVYQNLGEEIESNEYLEKAKIINPNDSNLIRFLGEIDDDINENPEIIINKSFEDKITNMIKNINS